MLNSVELHGIEFCISALKGRCIEEKASGKGLALSVFFDPENSDWLAKCAKISEQSDPNHGYKSQIRPELADEYENAGRVAI